MKTGKRMESPRRSRGACRESSPSVAVFKPGWLSDMVFGGGAFGRSPVSAVVKMTAGFLMAVLFLGTVAAPVPALAAEPFPEVKAKAHVVMEFETGLVLDGHREDEPLPPASMTKMMTEYLVLEKIRSGEIGWEDRVRISARAAAIDEAQVYLIAGEEWTSASCLKRWPSIPPMTPPWPWRNTWRAAKRPSSNG